MTRSTSALRCLRRASARWLARARRLPADAADDADDDDDDDDDDDPPWVDPVGHEDEELELPHPPPQAIRVGISKQPPNTKDRTIALIWQPRIMTCPNLRIPDSNRCAALWIELYPLAGALSSKGM